MTRTQRYGLVLAAAMVGALSSSTVLAQGQLSADDYVQIQQLYARYNHAIDSGDAVAWAKTFTEDGVFNDDNVGYEQLVAFAKNFHEGQAGHARHWNTNLVVTPTAEGADAMTYLMLYNTGVRPPSVIVPAIYHDKLVKTADGWRFKDRRVVPDSVAESGQ